MRINIKANTHKLNNRLEDCGYTLEEEAELYERQLQDIQDHPGEYLDNLDYLKTYRVRWKNYGYNTPTIPYRFIKETSPNKKGEVTDL